MSYTHLSSRWVNIRKPRRCSMCNTKSEPPARMFYSAGLFEGEFTTSYSCQICDSFMTPEKWKGVDYVISDGEIWEDPEYKSFRENYEKAKADPAICDGGGSADRPLEQRHVAPEQ